jgi:uncharacterized protein (TIGR02145 family)
MKRTLHLLVFLFLSLNIFAQAPQKMSYQAVIRNASNILITNAPVKMKISILQGSISGTVVYSELHSATTNANGLVSIEIGAGTSPNGTFSSINWGNGTYYVKTETDPNNSTNYTIVGTSQLMSVPYALHANCVASSLSGDTLFVGCKKYIIPGIVDISETTSITAHSCGATNVHNPNLTYGSVKDVDGNTYKTIQIGTQTWMAENLKTTKFRNGAPIPNITDNTQWQNNTTGAYCSYNNNTSNDCPYGKLYNWYAVKSANQLCPTGWHVPSDLEWINLENILGGAASGNVGNKMKSEGNQYWMPTNIGNNNSGFSAIPGGYRNSNGVSWGVGNTGNYWSSTGVNTSTAWDRSLTYNYGGLDGVTSNKNIGKSVRCIKD